MADLLTTLKAALYVATDRVGYQTWNILRANVLAINDLEKTGTGSPEGVQTASKGARYRQTDGTGGEVMWIKTSGSGNTGWESLDDFGGGGAGDVVGPGVSVEKEIALFDGTTGALLERATGTGFVKVTSGVYQTPSASIALSEMATLATDRLIGRDTAGSGIPEALTVSGGLEFTGGPGIQRSALTGDVTATAGSNATTIANDAVTFAKMQNVSAATRLLGRGSAAGSGDPEEIQLGAGLSMSGTTISSTVVGTGGGDVVGPASATDDRITTFDGATGKLVQDGGQTIAQVIAAAVAASGCVWIEEQTPTSTGTLTFSSLGSFTHLEIRWAARGTQAATSVDLGLRFNADTGNNYDRELAFSAANAAITGNEALGANTILVGTLSAASATSTRAGFGTIHIYDYRNTTLCKGVYANNGLVTSTASGGVVNRTWAGEWRSTAAVTSITLFLSAGNYDTASKFTLYGLK